jgi:hypothetical protein
MFCQRKCISDIHLFAFSLKVGALVSVPKCTKLGKGNDSQFFIPFSNSTTHSVYYSTYQS